MKKLLIWIKRLFRRKSKTVVKDNGRYDVLSPELREMIQTAMKPENIKPYNYIKGRLVWDSRRKGSYVTSKHGVLK